MPIFLGLGALLGARNRSLWIFLWTLQWIWATHHAAMHTTITSDEQDAPASLEPPTTATTVTVIGATETPAREPEAQPSGQWVDHTPALLAGDRLVLTVTEAGRLLGLSRAFTYELVARGEIPVIRLGRRIVVPKAALLEMVGVRPTGN
jgi:excisionase family DNA binding protein